MSLVKNLDDLLPQTQCRECGYPDCKSYAEALTQKESNIGLCAPGGITILKNIAVLLEHDPTPYFDETEKRTRSPATAIIREEECIGCKKCIQACPVDAIIGTAKHMHTILSDECTGCGLCIEPCPVDCIDLISLEENHYDKAKAKERYEAKQMREQKQQAQPSLKPENMSDILARLKKR